MERKTGKKKGKKWKKKGKGKKKGNNLLNKFGRDVEFSN